MVSLCDAITLVFILSGLSKQKSNRDHMVTVLHVLFTVMSFFFPCTFTVIVKTIQTTSLHHLHKQNTKTVAVYIKYI